MGSVSIAISCATPGAAIYYTTDGSNPTFPITGTTQLYTGPITVSTSETIKAIAQASPLLISFTATASYLVSAPSGLPNMPIIGYSNAASGDGLLGNSTYIDYLGNFNFVELLYYPTRTPNAPYSTYDQYMAAIRAQASAQGQSFIRLGKYLNSTRCSTSENSGSSVPFTQGFVNACADTLAAGVAWQLMSGPGAFPGGSPVVDSSVLTVLNMTTSVPNSTINSGRSAWTHGLNTVTGQAVFEWNTAVNNTGTSVGQPGNDPINAQCDYFFHDNFNWAPLSNFPGQYQCTSTVFPGEAGTSNNPTIAPALQAGYQVYFNKWRSMGLPAGRTNPIRHLANMEAFSDSPANGQGPSVLASMQGLIDMPYGEAGFGNVIYALSNMRTPNQFFLQMQLLEQARTTDPEAVCFFSLDSGGPFYQGNNWPTSQSNWTNAVTGQGPMPTNFGTGVATNATSSTHTFVGNFWQAARLMLGYAAQRSWCLDTNSIFSGALNWWLDEFNQSNGLGGGGYNWFGPLTPPSPSTPTLPISGGPLNGVYRTVFPNCTVWMNPLGNGPISYTLQPGDMKRALPNGGHSDPAVNTGALLTVLNLNDADCRILTN